MLRLFAMVTGLSTRFFCGTRLNPLDEIIKTSVLWLISGYRYGRVFAYCLILPCWLFASFRESVKAALRIARTNHQEIAAGLRQITADEISDKLRTSNL
jgi:hypothetical protein